MKKLLRKAMLFLSSLHHRAIARVKFHYFLNFGENVLKFPFFKGEHKGGGDNKKSNKQQNVQVEVH
jgi:hypothetical protein